jgi:hypothetical protein
MKKLLIPALSLLAITIIYGASQFFTPSEVEQSTNQVFSGEVMSGEISSGTVSMP